MKAPPSPALVAQSAVRRLPRWGLWLLGLAYVLPGFLGRDPWKRHDIEAFGFMLQLARPEQPGALSWLRPDRWADPHSEVALLPTWLGAAAIRMAPPGWEALAARLPFMLMLALTLLATWHAVYALARSDAAQPVAFAFGGEAKPVDYARTLADGALLALLACLGLAQLAHEVTPALAQLCCSALLLSGLARLPHKRRWSATATVAGMLGLTLSGGPTLALLLGGGGALIRALAPADRARRRLNMLENGLLALLGLLSVTLAGALNLWHWRIVPHAMTEWQDLARLLLWFTWPAGPLALWSLWRWRHQWLRSGQFVHIGLPFWFVLVTVGTTWLTGLSDHALLASLPAIAALAAFALPTLRRSVGAFMDWFTLLFFSIGALAIWVVWLSLETGLPSQPARNVARAAPEFVHLFHPVLLSVAVLMSIGWLALVRWRTGRHPAALWKSLVLPAAGTTLCWGLLMTLWLPLLNHGRSYAPLVARVTAVTHKASCVQVHGLDAAQRTALRYHGGLHLQAMGAPRADCPWLIADSRALDSQAAALKAAGWQERLPLRRPTDNDETLVIFEPARP